MFSRAWYEEFASNCTRQTEGTEHSEMAIKVEQPTYEESLSWLREHGFDLIEAPGMQGRVFSEKYNCSAAIQKDGTG